MQVSILSGTYTDGNLGVRTSYPVNLQPVFAPQGVSAGYLRPADGIIQNGTGPGICRGGINWDGTLYRVLGDQLCSVASDGTVTQIGSVGSDGKPVSMDYSFDYLCIVSSTRAFLYDGTTITEITDTDLGSVYDVIYIDGYFMFSDNENVLVNDLADPFAINPLKYASSEVDPDDVQGLIKVRNYAYVINRNTIEVFDNTGSAGFPFQRIESAQIPKGAIGRKAFTKFQEAIAFVGSDRNEQPSVYLGNNSDVQKIATREVDDILQNYTEAQLSNIVVEDRNDRGSEMLFIHLPDRTLVFDAGASANLESPVWFVLSSGIGSVAQYKARFFVYVNDRWTCSDPTSARLGYFTDTLGTQWGSTVTWEFGTSIIYNDSNGIIFNELELVCLPGRISADLNPTITTSYSKDGLNWSQDRSITVGTIGDRLKRLVWRRQGYMRNWRIQRFRGDTSAYLSFLRLEATLEPLNR